MYLKMLVTTIKYFSHSRVLMWEMGPPVLEHHTIVCCTTSYRRQLGGCPYGQKLSRLARKILDKFKSEISPWYENNMKSYTAFISLVDRRDFCVWDNGFPIMNTTFLLGGITHCHVSNFSIQLMFSAMSQPKTLPGKRDNVSPYE
jgi:hypothetical protein